MHHELHNDRIEEIKLYLVMNAISLTTQKVGVSLSGSGTSHTPVVSVPANHRPVFTETMVTQVSPHAEQVQLHVPQRVSWGLVSGTAAQPHGAGRGDGLSDDCPLCHHFPINLKHLRSMFGFIRK